MPTQTHELNIQDALIMSYDQYVLHLIKKYGPAKYNYFCNEACRSKNRKATRMQEGLFCHHIDENKEILLSTPEVARQHPFQYQKAERLVYCNFLEHLLLHIKIVVEDLANLGGEYKGVGLGGAMLIWMQLNGLYSKQKTSGWRATAFSLVKEKYEDYIEVMRFFYTTIKTSILAQYIPTQCLAQDWNGRVVPSIYHDIVKERDSYDKLSI